MLCGGTCESRSLELSSKEDSVVRLPLRELEVANRDDRNNFPPTANPVIKRLVNGV